MSQGGGGSGLAPCEGPRDREAAWDFAARMRPSKTFRTASRAFLEVHRDPRAKAGYGRAKDRVALVEEVAHALREYEQVYARLLVPGAVVPNEAKEAVMTRIYDAAIRHGETRGKWMLFVRKHIVDYVWPHVARATEAGILGTCSRVQPCADIGDESVALIAVFCEDFRNKQECEAALLGLKTIGLRTICGFKPSVLTIAQMETSVMAPLRLQNNWQMHLDLLRNVFPDLKMAETAAGPVNKGFNVSLLLGFSSGMGAQSLLPLQGAAQPCFHPSQG